jgi:chromosome segregation ATPase
VGGDHRNGQLIRPDAPRLVGHGEADEYLATTKSTIDSQVEVLATGQAALEKKVEEAEAMYQAREAKLKTWQADLEAREEAVTKAHSKAEDLRNTLQAKLSQLKSIAE